MVRRQRWQKSQAGFLARGKGPPAKESSLGNGPNPSAAIEDLVAVAPRSTQSPDQRQPDTSQDASIAAVQACDKLALLVYEDEDGNLQYEGSRSMQAKLRSKKSKQLMRGLQEVFETSHEPNSLADSFHTHAEAREGFFDISTYVIHRKTVSVADKDSLAKWYDRIFRLAQQLACKLIAKKWVSKIEPKKSGKYPYNGGKLARELGITKEEGGALKKPRWWGNFMHKEPDHMDMETRVELLLYILLDLFGMQCGTNDESQVDVKFLRAAVDEIRYAILRLSNGERSWQLLQEMFRVRAIQEQFLRGEIPTGATTVSLPEYEFPKAKRGPQKLEASDDTQGNDKPKRKRRQRSAKAVTEQDGLDCIPSFVEDTYAGSGDGYMSTSLASMSESSTLSITKDIKHEASLDLSSWQAMPIYHGMPSFAETMYNGGMQVMDAAPSCGPNGLFYGMHARTPMGPEEPQVPGMISSPIGFWGHNQNQVIPARSSNGGDDRSFRIHLVNQPSDNDSTWFSTVGRPHDATQHADIVPSAAYHRRNSQTVAIPAGSNPFTYGVPMLGPQPSDYVEYSQGRYPMPSASGLKKLGLDLPGKPSAGL